MVVVFVLLLYYKLVGMHSISLDGCCMSCTCIQTLKKKKNKKKHLVHLAWVVYHDSEAAPKMSLKYWYVWTAVFFSTLASWAALVTGYSQAHQYISTIHCCSVKLDFEKKVPSLSPADFCRQCHYISIYYGYIAKTLHTLAKNTACVVLNYCIPVHTYTRQSGPARLCSSLGALCSAWNQPICWSTSPNHRFIQSMSEHIWA